MRRPSFTDKVAQARANLEKLCNGIVLPAMRRVRQNFPCDEVADIAATVYQELESSGIKAGVKPGGRIAVCVGSRGMASLPVLVKTTVDWVRDAGGIPFIVPAMGSHGGATAEGQAELLRTLGVTEASVGAPVVSSMKTRVIGDVGEGYTVHLAEDVLASDGCILVCRIKPHTAFRGKYESGFMKMAVIGLGKHNGALVAHHRGFGAFKTIIPRIGEHILAHAPVLGGVGSIENAYYKVAAVKALRAEQFLHEEPCLLKQAFAHMGRVLFDDLDVLMIDKLGKNFSGDGMDPNVTGAFATPYGAGGITAQTRIVFALSEETHGNANGLGMADFTVPRVFEAFDPVSTYTNAMTARLANVAKIPVVMPDERLALLMGIYRSTRKNAVSAPRIAHIDNTEDIEYITISEALWEEARELETVSFAGEPFSYAFTDQGDIVRPWKSGAESSHG